MEPEFNHGVIYRPKSAEPTVNINQLGELRINYIRVEWVDLTNIVRFRVVPLDYFKKVLQSERPGFAMAKVTMGLVYLITADGFSATGEYLYVPDLSTLRLCPYAPGHASVLGIFEEKSPYLNSNGIKSVEVALCPRSILGRIINEAKSHGLEFLVGMEAEFILLKSTDPVQALNYHQWTATGGLPSGATETNILHEIAEALLGSGVDLQMYHPEAAPGQYEIVYAPSDPLGAADTAVHVRETIVNVAAKHGVRATFAPRVYIDSAGSSCHAHISVHCSKEQKQEDKLSWLESTFLAGVLEHLPALPAITLPIPASYKRVADGIWSGGTYVGWGTENREAPVRLVNATSPSSRRFEMRFIDGTANPYLALAAILAAGFEGIIKRTRLTIKDCSGPKSAAQMPREEREALGITKRLPLTREEAMANLASDTLFCHTFGQEFMSKYTSVHKALAEALEMDKDEAKALTRLVEYF